MSSRYRHELRIRYGEVDMQRHVFNAHYLAYIDDAFDQWLRARLGPSYETVLDMVVKRAELTWSGGAGFGDTLAIDVSVRRWGRTSFDVGFEGSVGERPIFDATLTYIAVEPGTTTPTPVPDEARTALA
jgi:acyl-CoA thioester hydrolase